MYLRNHRLQSDRIAVARSRAAFRLLPSVEASAVFFEGLLLLLQLHFGLEQNSGLTGFGSDTGALADSEEALVWLEKGDRSASIAALTHEMADCFLSNAALVAAFGEAEDVEQRHAFARVNLACD